jgi:hypothetical protein
MKQVENQIVNEVVDINPTLDIQSELLKSDLRDMTTVSTVFKEIFDHIEKIPVKDRTTDEKIYFFQYKEEIKRLYNNEKSIISKSKKKAEELGMTYDEYRAQVNTTGGGGGKANEYQYEEFYEASGFIFDNKLKLIDKCNSELKLFWYEVRDEKKRFDACMASKKCNMKKKEKALIVETVVETIEPVIEESSIENIVE